MLTQQQIDIVKATVPIVEKYGQTITEVFYKNLLDENPSLNEIFNQPHQATGHQAKALAGAVYAYAKNIESLGSLGPALEHITQKHASLYIRPEQYDVVGKYLLEAFGQVLGEAFTSEIRSVWAAAYKQLADIMIAAEARLYQQKGTWTDWRDFVIKEKTKESSEITSFLLEPVDKQPLPWYLPGQYVSVKTAIPALNHAQARQYSLSDKPSTAHYRISVKVTPALDTQDPANVYHPGYVSNVLHHERNPGDILQVSAPAGDFYLKASPTPHRTSTTNDNDSTTDTPPTTPVVLISAGVGVTPLLSMLNTLAATTPRRPVSWIQGARSTEARAFGAHVRQLASRRETDVRTSVFIKNPAAAERQGRDYDHAGRVDLAKCDGRRDLFLDDATALYFVCGPDGFMEDVKDALLRAGVGAERVQSERFTTG